MTETLRVDPEHVPALRGSFVLCALCGVSVTELLVTGAGEPIARVMEGFLDEADPGLLHLWQHDCPGNGR